MKKLTKYITPKNVLFFFCIVITLFILRTCEKSKLWNSYGQLLSTLEDTVRHFKNDEGDMVAEIISLTLTSEDVNGFNERLLGENDELKKQVKKYKNLVSYSKIKVVVRDTIIVGLTDTVIVSGTDTIEAKTFTWRDAWMNLHGMMTKKDSVSIYYGIRSDFRVTTFWKREGLFKKKSLVTQIKSKNPNVIITNAQNITIKPPPKKWYETKAFMLGLGFGAGILVNKL